MGGRLFLKGRAQILSNSKLQAAKMFHLSYAGGGHFGHIVKKPSTVSPPRIAVELVAAFPARPGGSSG